MAAGHIHLENQYPLQEVVRADGKFPYRPHIVSGPYLRLSRCDQALAHALARRCQICPRPQRKYEAQIGLKNMERQAAKAAPEPQHVLAKWRLKALVSKAGSHFAHLGSPLAVANCILCRTGTAGRAVLERVLTMASTNPTAARPINRASTPRPQPLGRPRDGSLENIAEVSLKSSQELLG